MHSALHYYAPHDPGELVNVSGAAVLASSSHQAAAQAFLAFLVSQDGPGNDRPQPQLRVPAAPRGAARRPACARSTELHPAPLTPAELGDGSAALALEQRLGLL